MILAVIAAINLTNMSWVSMKTPRALGVDVNILVTGFFTTILVATPIAIAIFYTRYFDLLTQNSTIK